MVHALERGENVSLAALDPEVDRVEVGVGWELDVAASGLDADLFAVLVGADGQVVSDRHLVFYNNDQSPEGAARLSPQAEGGTRGEDRQRLTLELAGMPPEVERVVVGFAVHGEERTLGDVSDLYVRVVAAPPDGPLGDELVRHTPRHAPDIATAVVLGEVYRYGDAWKVLASDQRYASGLRGVATDFGVHV
jgi:tellurium resistance protein TerD